MAKDYFRFKQFTVFQDKCAMKVCTDSCILGAYADPGAAKRMLDIGTGTGLLALMLAQRTNATIDAVEIEPDAAQQAQANFTASPWSHRLQLHHTSIQAFAANSAQLYDFIIANPPFFSDHLKRSQAAANIALHSDHLSLSELAEQVNRLLQPNGYFTVMLPVYQAGELEQLLQAQGLYANHKLTVFEKTNYKPIRLISTYARTAQACTTAQLEIRTPDGAYSPAFAQLLKDYYLIF